MKNPHAISIAWLQGIQRAVDFFWILFSGMLAYWFREGDLGLSSTYLIAFFGVALLNTNILNHLGVYQIHLPCCVLPQQLRTIVFGWGLSILALIVMLFFSHEVDNVSRIWVGSWLLLGFIGLILSRFLMTRLLEQWHQSGSLGERVVIVGAGDIGQWLLQKLEQQAKDRVRIIGIFDDRYNRLNVQNHGGMQTEIQGTTDDLLKFVREQDIDMIIIALPSQADDRLRQLVTKLRVLPVQIHVCPGRIGFNLERSEVVDIGGVPLLKVVNRPLEAWGAIMKRVEDVVLASLILILISPLLFLIALLIKIDSPGPVFFVQSRGGFNNKVFRMFKFRSMYFAPSSTVPGEKLEQARLGDSRITRIGGFLRRTSLDELPQFLNVLKGDMSIVGPRPHAVEHDQEFSQIISSYVSRLRVKPGITGWAQIHGFRGLTDTREKLLSRLEYDIYYVDNWSVWLDLWIILRTTLVGMIHENAY